MKDETDESFPGATISIFTILRTMWKAKYLALTIVALFALCGAAFAFLAPSWYQATVLLVPVEDRTAEGMSGQLGGLAGLAGLAGIHVGGDNTAVAIGVLKSRELTQAFIQEQGLMAVMFADDWDPEAQKWRSPSAEDWPDLRRGIRYFDENVRSVKVDRVTGLVTLVVEWRDPELAAKWANALVKRVNNTMRARSLVEAEANVAYLQRELSASNVVTLQSAIGRLLESELQKLMLARGNEEFAFRVIDSAQVPDLRSWPPRALIVALSLLLGVIVAAFFSIFSESVGRRYAHRESAVLPTQVSPRK